MDVQLDVNGFVRHPLSLSLTDLREKYTPATVSVQFLHDDHPVNATFTGARLWDILQTAGLKDETNVNLRVRARAADRFRCHLRLNEINPATSDRVILVAYEQDGAPLGAGAGPLRLAVPGDPMGLRYLRGLVMLTVLEPDKDEV